MFEKLGGDSLMQFGTPIPGNMISSNQFMFTHYMTKTEVKFQLPGMANSLNRHIKVRPVVPAVARPTQKQDRSAFIIPSA